MFDKPREKIEDEVEYLRQIGEKNFRIITTALAGVTVAGSLFIGEKLANIEPVLHAIGFNK